jgi:hypothetical protein
MNGALSLALQLWEGGCWANDAQLYMLSALFEVQPEQLSKWSQRSKSLSPASAVLANSWLSLSNVQENVQVVLELILQQWHALLRWQGHCST